MKQKTAKTETTDISDDVEAEILCNNYWKLYLFDYVENEPESKNTQLFSVLVLLNAYVPKSYLRMDECQQILGPPDLIHGGPPFEERMEPFTFLISPNREAVSVNPVIAQRSVELLHSLKINRSATVKKLMHLLCGAQSEQRIADYVKDLLTKREVGENGQEDFSRLICDIKRKERFHRAFSVLESASEKFRTNAIFPQTIARLHHKTDTIKAEKWAKKAIARAPSNSYMFFLKFPQNPNIPQTISRLYHNRDTIKAEKWAKEAIERDPNNSFIADTLGQVYKKRLEIASDFKRVQDAFKAFKDVERKAEREDGPEMMDMAEAGSMSLIFNNRGLFGFLQVAKIAFEKLSNCSAALYPDITREVEDKFDFFEWYLTYSKPDMTTLEPPYFWKDVALCYKSYTNKTAADSTSFPGLLDLLNHGLFMSKGRRAKFKEAEKTASDLETLQQRLKLMFEENDDIKLAESYILSNILLSNRMPDCPQLSPMKELQKIIHTFLGTEVASSRSEFYLLVLMLFWPEEQLQVLQEEDDEEVEPKATEDSGSTNTTWDSEQDQEQDPHEEPAQLLPDLDLQKYVTLMENAFEKAKYAKYLRGRYLLPLFFLGKGSGLSKWIHKSRLDAIIEEKVDTELKGKQNKRIDWKEKVRQINDMWRSGKVWHIADIRDLLLPVQTEPRSATEPEEDEEQEVFVCAGRQKIKVRTEDQPPDSALPPMLSYLGFTIQGPVVFRVGAPHSDCQ